MYHIIYDLETKFGSLEECQLWLNNLVLSPRIPYSRMEGEDGTTPRICVSDTIEGCITAIGVEGVFRRCCNSNEDAPSYENDNEAYPIIVAELPNDLNYKMPSKQEVPDVAVTGERWLLEPAKPVCQIMWLGAYSLDFYWDEQFDGKSVCNKVQFLSDLSGYDHPWINKKGHPLDCSYLGSDVWPDCKPGIHPMAQSMLYWDLRRQQFVFPVPVSNSYAVCHPVQITDQDFSVCETTYRCVTELLKPFSGFHDLNGHMIFEGDRLVKQGSLFNLVRRNGQYVLEGIHTQNIVAPSQEDMSEMITLTKRPA